MTFLRWMGGKREVVHQFKHLFPDINNCRGYIEPFLGGGSVFYYIKQNYDLENRPVFLSDINKELIITYKVVRDNFEELIPLLKKHQKLNNKEYYLNMKKVFPAKMSDVEIAAAFIYLSKSTFGSQWGVNSKGKLVSSYRGNEGESIFDEDILKSCSRLLQNSNIADHSFELVLKLNKGDLKNYFVYCCLPDTKIRMRDEILISINDIKMGDITFLGGKTLNNICRDYNGEVYEFEVMGIYDNLFVTEEHPLAVLRQERAYDVRYTKIEGSLVSRFKHQEILNLMNYQFIKAKDIRIGDFVLIPCYMENILKVKTVKIGDVSVNCDEVFGWICGCWLAEGHTERNYYKDRLDNLNDIKNGKQSTLIKLEEKEIDELIEKNIYETLYSLTYSCGQQDFEFGFIDRLNDWYNHYFGKTGHINKLPWNCYQIKYVDEDLTKFIYSHFDNKKISKDMLNYPKDFQRGLLRGWIDGDGCIWNDKRNRGKITGTSKSEQLALDMYIIALRLGLRPALKSRNKNGKQIINEYMSKVWEVHFSSDEDIRYLCPHIKTSHKERSKRKIIVKGDKKYILSPIIHISRKKYNGKVYNLTTENHIYVANYILNHNCDPPYYSVNVKNYAKDGFSLDTKMKIPFVFKELDKIGAKVMMSNADCPIIYKSFKDYYITVIKTNRSTVQLDKITKEKMENEDDVTEVVVTNYEPPKRQLTIDDAW